MSGNNIYQPRVAAEMSVAIDLFGTWLRKKKTNLFETLALFSLEGDVE